jgi:hypothetical protein
MLLTMPIISADFPPQATGHRPQATGHRPQATGNYGAEFRFVKYLASNSSLFVSLFPLKYDTTADDFFPHTVAGSKSVLELGRSALNGGNPGTELGNSTANGGNPNMELDKSGLNGGNPDTELGNSIPNGGNFIPKLGNFTSNGGNSASYKNKEKL